MPGAEPASTQPVTTTGPSGLRASDADRQQVADVLSAAYAEGRLTLDEHDERLDQAMRARTFDELIPVTRDLVYAHAPATPAPQPLPDQRVAGQVDTRNASGDPERLVAVFGSATRKGKWRMRRQTQAYALFGGIDLDLRDAVLEAPEVEISGIWCFGGLDIKVPPGMEIRDQTMGIFGGTDIKHAAPPEPGAPVLVIKGLCLFGGVSVKSPRPRRRDNPDAWSRGDSRAEQIQDRIQDRIDRQRQRIEDRQNRRGW